MQFDETRLQNLYNRSTLALALTETKPGTPPPAAVFPGSFNPFHQGHQQMLAVACEVLQRPVDLEISIENVDKPTLDAAEIADRVSHLPVERRVWVTRAATFAEKSRLFPNCTFVVGVDTIQRLAAVKYYHDSSAANAAIEEIHAHNCRFLVFGRLVHSRFLGCHDVVIPPRLSEICQSVPSDKFRADISSTELRQARKAP